MAGTRRAPAKPEVIDLRGKTGPQIAEMVRDGEVTIKHARDFVADRAVRKLDTAYERLQS